MDRKINNSQGFTLIELIIVVAIISIIVMIAANKFTQISQSASIGEDIHSISSFLKRQRLNAFSIKERIDVSFNPGGDLISAASDPLGAKVAEGSISLNNAMVTVPANTTFSINSRGLFSNTGSIRLSTLSQATSDTCITITASRVRIGTWNNGTNTCDLK